MESHMAKKAAASKSAGDKPAKVKAATKAELYGEIAGKTGLSKKQVASVFDAFIEFSKKELGKKGPGVVLLPGVGKIKAKRVPATKATTKPNPFKPGEMMTVKAKPASTRVKIVALKAYKDAL
jgi:nucleoid DNA-binding protein